MFVNEYFKVSPSAFFCENEFYKDLSNNLKVKLMVDELGQKTKDNEDLILPSFREKFNFLFDD